MENNNRTTMRTMPICACLCMSARISRKDEIKKNGKNYTHILTHTYSHIANENETRKSLS